MSGLIQPGKTAFLVEEAQLYGDRNMTSVQWEFYRACEHLFTDHEAQPHDKSLGSSILMEVSNAP